MTSALEILADQTSSLVAVQKALKEAEAELTRSKKIGLSSNVTIEMLSVYLRRYAALASTKLSVVQGNYDDPIGDMDMFANEKVDYAIMLPFFDNLLPAFESQIATLSPEVIAAKEAELRSRYRLAFEKGKTIGTIFLCLFHRLGSTIENNVRNVIDRFNSALQHEAANFSNIRIIEMDDVISIVGRSAAFDLRFYFSSKAPYSNILFNKLASNVSLMTRGFGSYFYKALILDCDNTLWGGIIGEDLLAGIKLNPYDYPSNIFWRVQNKVAALENNGTIICLCSKNNPDDVEEVLTLHPNMVIKNRNLVIKKVNWNDKVSNIREIAKELNIGLDSLVFVDDSDFEVEAVRSQLPMVKVFQVPKKLSDYPVMFQEIVDLFLAGGVSAESRSKTEQYKQIAAAESLKAEFGSQEDYMKSLELKVELSRNLSSSTPRISELTQKSNQFNLTTRRYSEAEIASLMADEKSDVFSLVVKDKFGDSGLTGVAVISYNGNVAKIDNFLMSCRVIGRGVELVIWETIAREAIAKGCIELQAEYIPTAKNAQVLDFYDKLGISLIEENNGVRRYKADLSTFAPPATGWIEVFYD